MLAPWRAGVIFHIEYWRAPWTAVPTVAPCLHATFCRPTQPRVKRFPSVQGTRRHKFLSRPNAMELFEAKKKEVEVWMGKQPPSVEVAVATGSGAVQGGLIGAMMATFSSMEPPGGAAASMAPKARTTAAPCTAALCARCATRRVARRALIASPKVQPPGMVGGPAVLARNFAVMTGVNAGLQCAIQKARGGVEDVKGRRVTCCVACALVPCRRCVLR